MLRRRLGGGGFGAVYEAVDDDGQVVAAKVLRVDRAALSADARTRFRREAQALVSLRHPRIVAIHAHGTSEDGLEYLVMDLLRGEDLAEHLHRRRRVPLREALELFDGMAEAVQFAHEQGFAHRDLKPANVFLREAAGGGVEPIVLDFGLAKMVEGSEESLTATGMVLGTPHYMAPEQATGEKVDRRADVYALGCILFEMITGAPPFNGNTPTAILMQVLTTPPPAISPDLQVPAGVEQTIRQALAKDPEDRFTDVAAFRDALKVGLESVPMTRMMAAATTDPPPATREARALSSGVDQQRATGRSRLLVPMLGAALLTLVAGGAALWWFGLRDTGVEVAATAPTQVDLAPIDEHDEAIPEEVQQAAADSGVAELGAPPTEVPDAPPEENPTMRSLPSQMRGRRVTTHVDSPMVASMSTGPSATASGGAGGGAAEEVRRLEAKLDEVERVVAAVSATRRGLEQLAGRSKPRFCGRGGLPSGSENGYVVGAVQSLRRIRGAACDPFDAPGQPDADTVRKLRRVPQTVEHAEEMATSSIAQQQHADDAQAIAQAIAQARQVLRGVEDGSRPFPCEHAVFGRLRRLRASSQSAYAGAGARDIVRLQQDICRNVGGISAAEASRLADDLNGQLDEVEGRIGVHERDVRRALTSARFLAR